MPDQQHPPDSPTVPPEITVDTVAEHLRVYASWLREKVRWASTVDHSTITLPSACAERLAGLLDYAAGAEERR